MDARSAGLVPRHLPRRTPWSVVQRLEAPVEAIGFWAAIGLPLGYLILVTWRIDGRLGLVGFVSLLWLHLIALVVGHDHKPTRFGRARIEA